MVHPERREVGSDREQVGGEVGGEGGSVGVMQHLLSERLAHRLSDAPVDLAVYQNPVEDAPAVVHRHVPQEAHRTGLPVHLHHRDVTAEGVGGLLLRMGELGAQTWCLGVGEPAGVDGQTGQLGPVQLRARGSGDTDSPVRSEHHVLRGGLVKVGHQAAGLLQHCLRRHQHRGAPQLEGPRSHGAPSPLHLPGVALDHPHSVEGDAQQLRHHLGEGGLVPLAVGGRAGTDHGIAGQVDLNGPPLLAVLRGGDLHVARHPHPHQRGGGVRPPPLLLVPQRRVVGEPQRPLQRRRVVAAVVESAGGRPVGEGVRRQEVAAPHLCGIEAEAARHQVHHPLQGGGGLGASRPPVGVDRGGVGHDAAPGHLGPGDAVGAGGHQPGEVRQVGAEQGVGAGVLGDAAAEGHHPAVPTHPHLDLVQLCPPLCHGHEVLAAALLPAHGTSQAEGEGRRQHLLGVDGDLRPEAAAHVGYPHPQLGAVEAQQAGDGGAVAEHVLRAHPQLQAVPFRYGESVVGLERDRRQPLVADAGGEHQVGVVHQVGHRGIPAGQHLVAAQLRVEEGGIPGEGVLHGDGGGKRVGVHPHRLGGVGRRRR